MWTKIKVSIVFFRDTERNTSARLQCIGLALVKGDGASIDGDDDNGGKGIGPSSDINL